LPILCHSRYGSLPQSEFCQDPSRSDRFCTLGVGILSGHPKPANKGHLKTGQR
jgi:hypothetical protein